MSPTVLVLATAGLWFAVVGLVVAAAGVVVRRRRRRARDGDEPS